VIVAELVPAVVEWNRGPLAPLAERPLEDRRVRVFEGDVLDALRGNRAGFDAVILDVDNGPRAFTDASNAALYTNEGIATARGALRDNGVLAVWSAWEDRKFEQRLRYAGFTVKVTRECSPGAASLNGSEAGVLGVTVFLDVALRSVGIDPRRQPFTVKLTKKGKYIFICTPHQALGMKVTVTVS